MYLKYLYIRPTKYLLGDRRTLVGNATLLEHCLRGVSTAITLQEEE